MKKIGKIVAVALSAVLVLALLTACGGKKEPEPTVPGSAGSSGSSGKAVFYGEYTGPDMTLEVNLSSSKANAEYIVNAFDRITARTDGKVKFNITEQGGLLSPADALEGLGSGVADISDLTLSNYSESFVYTTVACAQPFMGFRDIDTANDIIRDVIINNPNELMENEFYVQNVKPLSTAAVFGTSLFCAKDVELQHPADLNGLKIMSDDPVISEFVNSVGGAAVQLNVMEMSSNMKNGVADGAFVAQNVGEIFGADVASKSLNTFAVDLSTHVKTTCINLTTWDSFDDTLKKIFDEEFGESFYEEYLAWVDKMESQRRDKFAANAEMHRYEVPADLIPEWQAAIEPFASKALSQYAATNPDTEQAKQIWRDAIDNYYAGK